VTPLGVPVASGSQRLAWLVVLRPRCVVGLLALLGTIGLTGCVTGERPSFSDDATAAGTTTGDPAIDAVLTRFDTVSGSVFTADYTIDTVLTGVQTPAKVVQTGPSRRSITIGDIRFIVEGAATATCNLGIGGSCSGTLDDNLTSDRQVGHQFYAESMAARLRTDAGRVVAATTSYISPIAGQQATCVDVPVDGGTKTYCALDSGVVARFAGGDLRVELTAYSDVPDEAAFARTS
jgi:hypothetical protein